MQSLEAELRSSLHKINASPSPVGWSFNPVALVRAVNHLQALGVARALAVLRSYVNLVEQRSAQTEYQDTDVLRVLFIIRLLFEAQSGNVSLPALALGQPDVTLPQQDPMWPHLPLVLSLELPFLPVGGYFVGGALLSSLSFIEMYAQQGRFRTVPLTPQGAPANAVDALLASAAWQTLVPAAEAPRVEAMLFGQALRAAAPAYVVPEAVYQALSTASPAELAVLWRYHADMMRKLNLQWDAAAQSFHSALTPVP